MGTGEAAVLGLLQGVTEFLPVSSSGHLVLAQHWLGVKTPGLTFEVLVHFGTLLAIFAVFRERVASLAAACFRLASCMLRGEGRRAAADPDIRLLLWIVLGSLPAGLGGVALRHVIGDAFSNVRIVGWMLLVTGTLLWLAGRAREGHTSLHQMSPGQALLIGVFQALALLPGISRSGSTIASGLYSGLDREAAGSFSFLLAIPAIFGATLLELKDLVTGGVDLSWSAGLAGIGAATLSGYAALRLLLRFVRAGKLHWFSYYAWAMGAFVVLAGTAAS